MHILATCKAPGADEIVRPKCPRCGSVLLMAERSAFDPNGRVRNTWSCDDCGNEFVTSVRVFARQSGRRARR